MLSQRPPPRISQPEQNSHSAPQPPHRASQTILIRSSRVVSLIRIDGVSMAVSSSCRVFRLAVINLPFWWVCCLLCIIHFFLKKVKRNALISSLSFSFEPHKHGSGLPWRLPWTAYTGHTPLRCRIIQITFEYSSSFQNGTYREWGNNGTVSSCYVPKWLKTKKAACLQQTERPVDLWWIKDYLSNITQDLTSSFSSMSGNELVPFCDRTYNNRL